MNVTYYIDRSQIEENAQLQIDVAANFSKIESIAVFPDIHYCAEKAIPVGLAFSTENVIFPLVTGKDMGCGVAYIKIPKSKVLKRFDKHVHYNALNSYQNTFTDERLGGGNHFLSLEEDNENLYVICHTGTRNLGIHMYQSNYRMLQENGNSNFIHVDKLLEIAPNWFEEYDKIIQYGKKRRMEFCVKTVQFLINNNYVIGQKTKAYDSAINIWDYEYGDSVHNHIKKEGERYIHRKGSTELNNDIVVIPLSMTRGSLFVKKIYDDPNALNSCAHGAGRKLSRIDTLKYWHSSLKEKERVEYAKRFSEMLDRSGKFSNGYLQEFDFAYKDSTNILSNQPYLRKITETVPVATFKFTEI